MYQYDDPTVTSVLPPSTASGASGYFTDGNPGGGQAATILRAEFMNMLMMEILNTVTGAGITPSKSTNTQLREAINAYIAEGLGGIPAIPDASTTVSGIVKLATTAETVAGTDSVRVVTPAGLAGFSKSFSANGYAKLPGGLIVQWTTLQFSSESGATVTLPITFPTSILGAVASTKITGTPSNLFDQWPQTYNWTQSSVGIYMQCGNNSQWPVTAFVMAIGY